MVNTKLSLSKFTLMITLRCTLRCKLCSENIPFDKPGEDMNLEDAEKILKAFFDVVDYVKILHISGGEPLLHPQLTQIIEECMKYREKFDKFMLFTNSTVKMSDSLISLLNKYKDCIIVHASDYNFNPVITNEIKKILSDYNINNRYLKYHGDEQDFGGWVDFGDYKLRNESPIVLKEKFSACAITSKMNGNWRTRDGKIFWCTRAHRGYELGLVPIDENDYVDILNIDITIEEKRKKFKQIENAEYISACNYCSGDCGTQDSEKRHAAAIQI